MKTPTTRSFKTLSFGVFLLTIFFFAFFDNSKHIPALALVNPFADDPYDAVGSFGIQLSFFAALLSLLRAFRPYATKEVPPSQQLLILRAETVALLSVVVTLIMDVAAMFRYPSMWMHSFAGLVLAGLVGGLILLAALTGLLLYRMMVNLFISFANRSWTKLIFFPISILILAVYPTDLQDSVLGGIFSAFLGMVLLFVSTWAWATTIFPQIEIDFEDVFDDVASLYRRLKSHIGFLPPLENLIHIKWVQGLFRGLNPRKHKWYLILLIALAMGISILFAEAMSEGLSTNPMMVLLVIGVFISIEGMGVVLGYFLFAEFLGIFRKE